VDTPGTELLGCYITNTSYAYTVIRDGNNFSKKFGGATGNDPDWFVLHIVGKKNGTWLSDSVHFYLADFRFDDNNQDYIVGSWEWVDLSILGDADTLYFELRSSDAGLNGINTPTFF